MTGDYEPSVEPLTVVELTAENIMRLTAVQIRPDSDQSVIEIAGANGSGKTSVLNAIWLALGGKDASKHVPVPIHVGADEGTITLDLGSFRVTRTFNHRNTTGKLTVTAPDGSRFTSPQTFLDEFLGKFTFDPLTFMRQKPNEQLATLLPLVELPFDLDVLDTQYKTRYQARTVIGNERDMLKGQLAGVPSPADDAPDTEVSITELLDAANEARELVASNNAARAEALRARERHLGARADVRDLEERLVAARIVESDALTEAEMHDAWVADLPPDPDVHLFEDACREAETINTQVRAARQYRELAAKVQDAVERYEGETLELALIQGRKKNAIETAVMPLDGLSFDDSQVLFNGLPIQQCSAAEQLRISMAIGMAMNPKIRVMCIPDGSLLDDTSRALVETMAAENGFQVFLEVVGSGDGTGFVIEDGQLAGDAGIAAFGQR